MSSNKRAIFTILLFGIASVCFCQNYYKCNTDSVAVLVDACEECDTFYIATPYYDCVEGQVFINKGFVFMSKDVIEGKFTKIYNRYNNLCWDEGWIPSRCLTPATRCSLCKGKGTTGKRCDVCNGDGAWACCQFKGSEVCERCKGIGYY